MKTRVFALLLALSAPLLLHAQIPSPALIGYWHNWNDFNAPYLPLTSVDQRYNVVALSFAIPETGTDCRMTFVPDQVTPAVLLSQIQQLQSQGRKVLISIGGATAHVSLDNIAERDTFIATMNSIINQYGFDGIDIDLEGSSVSVTGGTIANPTDAKIIHLIDAVKQIMSDYYVANQKKMILTMAPETAFVQGGMSAYGGIWGAYLPIINALRDSLDMLQVQLYNSGTMYGINGGIYTQGTADFIVAMTEAVIQGFNTSGGFFTGLPASKVAVGLPACQSAAGGGYTAPGIVRDAVNYLLGNGSQPGTYTLAQTGGYPSLGGMMTWSVNWDAVNSCATSYEYADNFEQIFGTTTGMAFVADQSFVLAPNPATDHLTLYFQTQETVSIRLYNSVGSEILSADITSVGRLDLSELARGIYTVRANGVVRRFVRL